MKFHSAAVLAICIPSSAAFVISPNRNNAVVSSHLNLFKDDGSDSKKNWLLGPFITTAAGLTLASQVAGATIVLPLDESPMQQTNNIISIETVSGSSLQIAANNQDFLDFSLPSYGDSVASSSAAKKDAPNLLKDFDFSASKADTIEETASVPDEKDAEAAKQAKAEKEAEEQQKKVDAKAAAEAAKQQRKEEDAEAKAATEKAKQQRKEEEAQAREEKKSCRRRGGGSEKSR